MESRMNVAKKKKEGKEEQMRNNKSIGRDVLAMTLKAMLQKGGNLSIYMYFRFFVHSYAPKP